MPSRNRFAAIAACLLGLAISSQGMAQTAPSTRVRGTINAIEGNAMAVVTREGQPLQIMLDDKAAVSTVKKVELSSIAPGSYVGIASRPLPDRSLQAIEVLVFPDSMRGVGEGHRPWDLEPGSQMTNATVSGTVQATSGRDLTLTYPDGKQTIHVPPDAPVVTFAPAERSDLKPGAPVFLSATRGEGGTLHASRVTVGKDGVAPPM